MSWWLALPIDNSNLVLCFFYSIVTQWALSSLLVRDDFTSQCPLLVIWVFFSDVEILIWKVKSFWSHHFNFLVAICCLFCHWFHNEELVSDDSTGLTLMTSPRPQWEGIAFLRATVSSWLLVLLPWNKKWDLPPLRALQLLSVSETSHFFYLWCWCPHLLRKVPHLPEKAECSMVSLILSYLYIPGAHWEVNHLDHFPPLHMSPLLPAPERRKSSFLYSKNYRISYPQISYFQRMTDKANVNFFLRKCFITNH